MRVGLVVVGAGPAGLAAAVEAARHGMSVLLLDEGAGPGGRVWQAIETRGIDTGAVASRDDLAAKHAVAAFRASSVAARFRATVWAIENRRVVWSENGSAHSVEAGAVLLATGTTERPVPVPGWTLPGVMTVGAAQILLKTSGLVPGGRTWIAGQGPLMLLYAAQALDAGGQIAGVLDLSPGGLPRSGVPRLGLMGALRSPGALAKGATWRRRIIDAGVLWVRAADVEATGDGRLERVSYRAEGIRRVEDATALLLHDGVIPSVQLSRAVGCVHEWDRGQACWRPAVDAWGRTSVPGVLIAGDGAGVGGWAAAALGGRIAALGVVADAGLITRAERDRLARPARVRRGRRLALRPMLDALYPPLRHALADTTIVCRCEEVTAHQVRAAAGLGCLGLNQLKAFTRAGMGACQGRMCAPTLQTLLADARGVAPEMVDALRTRFPTKPVTLGELAALDA